jgi:CarD family transcriptional regulator
VKIVPLQFFSFYGKIVVEKDFGGRMHSIGDRVVYGANGVMEIVDVREESIGDVSRSYYVLTSVCNRSDSLIFVPCDSERLVSAMRPLLTRDEAIDLIRRIDSLPDIEWIESNRARAEHFKKLMESADREAMFSMIRAIDENAKRREAEGKKNFLTDETARQKAERLLYSELSLVLEIPTEEIPSFIKNC